MKTLVAFAFLMACFPTMRASAQTAYISGYTQGVGVRNPVAYEAGTYDNGRGDFMVGEGLGGRATGTVVARGGKIVYQNSGNDSFIAYICIEIRDGGGDQIVNHFVFASVNMNDEVELTCEVAGDPDNNDSYVVGTIKLGTDLELANQELALSSPLCWFRRQTSGGGGTVGGE